MNETVFKFREYIISLDKHEKEILSYFYGADQSWKMRTIQEVSNRFHMGESLISKIIAKKLGEFAHQNNLDGLTAFKLWRL